VFSIEHAQLLAQGNNFKAEIAARTEKGKDLQNMRS
jgi:hypothetical protein